MVIYVWAVEGWGAGVVHGGPGRSATAVVFRVPVIVRRVAGYSCSDPASLSTLA